MTMMLKKSTWVLSCAATAAALAFWSAPAAAQQRTSESRIQQLIHEASELAARGQTSTPTTAQQGGQTAAPTNTTKVPLTLDEAVRLALERNLDIAVQRLNPEISDLGVATARAAYFPSLT